MDLKSYPISRNPQGCRPKDLLARARSDTVSGRQHYITFILGRMNTEQATAAGTSGATAQRDLDVDLPRPRVGLGFTTADDTSQLAEVQVWLQCRRLLAAADLGNNSLKT